MVDATDLHALEAKGGSPDGFSALYARLAPALTAWCRIRTTGSLGRHVQAEDLFQEVWWRALTAFTRFDPEKGSFRPWVFSIAHNVCSEALRSRPERRVAAKRPGTSFGSLEGDLEATLTSITEACRRNEHVAILVDQVNALAKEDRRLFQLRGLEGLSLRETGHVLGLSEDATKKRWQRLREELKSLPAWREFVEDS